LAHFSLYGSQLKPVRQITDYRRITPFDRDVRGRLRQGPIQPGGYLVPGSCEDSILGDEGYPEQAERANTVASRLAFEDASRPEPVRQNPIPVGTLRLVVHAFDFHRHSSHGSNYDFRFRKSVAVPEYNSAAPINVSDRVG